jgi:hypothetical protein
MIERQITEDRTRPSDRALDTASALDLDDQLRKGLLGQVFSERSVADYRIGLTEQTAPARCIEITYILQNNYSRSFVQRLMISLFESVARMFRCSGFHERDQSLPELLAQYKQSNNES